MTVLSAKRKRIFSTPDVSLIGWMVKAAPFAEQVSGEDCPGVENRRRPWRAIGDLSLEPRDVLYKENSKQNGQSFQDQRYSPKATSPHVEEIQALALPAAESLGVWGETTYP